MHGVRQVDDLAYADYIARELPQHEFLGEQVRDKLVYYPTVTREPFRNHGRLTDLIDNGKLCGDIGLPPIDPTHDRVMICGSPAMLADMRALLDARGFTSRRHREPATTCSSARSSRSERSGEAPDCRSRRAVTPL